MCLIADIGGTNARFALVDEGDNSPQYERTLSCANYRTLVDAVLAYLEDVSQSMPETASLAIATPVSKDRIVMTNHVWDLSVEETRKTLGLKSLKVLNDYTALALALPYLGDDDYHKVGGGTAVDKQTMAVLGPGTGLGVSGAICAGNYWLPLESEGGHVSYGPLNRRETEVIDVILKYHSFLSAESLVSGPGLVLLYESIAKCDGVEHELLSPEQIANKALQGTDPSAEEAVAMFCGILGSVAGNLALTLGARGGVFVGGGIIPKLGGYFDSSPFRTHFESKGRFSQYMSEIPTNVITSKYPALTGAAVAVMPQYDYLGATSVID
ncbi:MAG: glucokinase [Gammaproteobacteria bacterium]